MSLYNLKREYEERRRQLVEQLQRNPSLDPATQHQIYGAIKEIENFLKTIDYQIASEQEKDIDVDLASPRPNQFMERTKGALYHVQAGTKKVFTHHIPNAARKVTAVPKKYFDKRREEIRLRREIEAEVRQRRVQQQLEANSHHVTLEHPHQELPQKEAAPAGPLPTWNDETVQKVDAPVPEKRPKSFARPKKGKNRPSARAHNKHPHKPHLKKEKFTRGHRR